MKRYGPNLTVVTSDETQIWDQYGNRLYKNHRDSHGTFYLQFGKKHYV